MGVYEWVLFVHILAGVAWFGGVIFVEAMRAGATRTGGDAGMVRAFIETDRVTRRLFPPVTIVLIAAGVYMVLDNDAWEFEQAWLSIAFILFVVSFAVEIGYFGPKGKRVEVLAAEHGHGNERAVALAKRVNMVARVESVALLVVLLLMVWKPGS